MIALVCQSFDVFLSFHATRNTLVNQHTLTSFNVFHILGRISSSPASFPVFNPRRAAATSANMKTSFFPKLLLSHMSARVALTGFNKFSKNSFYRERIFFSSLRISLVESLKEAMVLKFFPRIWRMVCQNTLFADELSESNRRPNSFQEHSLNIPIVWAAVFLHLGIPGLHIRWWSVLLQGPKRIFLCSDSFLYYKKYTTNWKSCS